MEPLLLGVFSVAGAAPRPGVAIGDSVLDLAAAADAGALDLEVVDADALRAALHTSDLNGLLALGPTVWEALRQRLGSLIERDAVPNGMHPRDAVTLHLPIAVADYVDFYASLEHATNAGRIFRPTGEPLPPAWRNLPIGYHGRSGTIVVSGTPIRRPQGLVRDRDGTVALRPTSKLDFELEVGFVVGAPSTPGRPVAVDEFADHVFGVVLVNDWSARDIQALESQPLGPFQGKSFATSMSGWITSLAALEHVRVAGPPQDPPAAPHLQGERRWGYEIDLEAGIRPAGADAVEAVCHSSFASMYWTAAQMLAHLTANGTAVRTGDVFASGTVSGAGAGEQGCLLEATADGRDPITLPSGATRTYLLDGDEVVLRGRVGAASGSGAFGLGEVRGTVTA